MQMLVFPSLALQDFFYIASIILHSFFILKNYKDAIDSVNGIKEMEKIAD